MAKIVGGSPIGMLSGKEGGRVFSFNQAGQYTRQYVTPVNPNTEAQLRARSRFAFASGSYHSLSESEKANWGTYATEDYNPKGGINMGQFSGFNTYVALHNAVANASQLSAEPDIEVNNSSPGTPATFNAFSQSQTPPTNQLQPNIAEEITDAPLNLSMRSADLVEDGTFSFSLNVEGGVSGGSDIKNFMDAVGNPFGFAVYSSNGLTQENMFFSNPEKHCLGYIKQPQLDSADRTGVETLGFDLTSPVINPGNSASFPVAGQSAQFTVYSISADGMFAKIGTIISTVSSS